MIAVGHRRVGTHGWTNFFKHGPEDHVAKFTLGLILYPKNPRFNRHPTANYLFGTPPILNSVVRLDFA